MSQESDPASRPAAQWQAPDRLTLDRTEVTGKYDWRCFQNTDALASKPKKKGSLVRAFFELVGTIGFEPTTPTMSRWCSNQLSYVPSMGAHSKWMKKRVKQFFLLTH